MTLKQQLTEDMKQAMRAREMLKLNTIRFLISDIRNFEIDNGEQDDAGVLKIVARQVKQMKDAVSEFAKGDRTDLIEEEKQKIAVLEAYLPQQMSDEALSAIVTKVVSAQPGMNMGQAMSEVMKQVQGQADGGRVSALVKKALQQ
ncbi:MAG: GatB/YqeY domain-containing protein [bacterium]|nr:GatB/YqeY domain-containing protein [bacterium]